MNFYLTLTQKNIYVFLSCLTTRRLYRSQTLHDSKMALHSGAVWSLLTVCVCQMMVQTDPTTADSVCLSDDGTDRPHHCSCTSHCYSRNILRLVWPRIKYWYGRCVLYCFTNIIFKTNPNNLSPVSRWGAGELEGGRADMSNCNKIVTSCLLSEYDGSSSKNSKLNPKSCFA